jgi:hypothetical protein
MQATTIASRHRGSLDLTPRDLGLKPCPPEGRHRWMYGAVCRLVENAFTDREIVEWISENLTRRPQPREIEVTIHKVRQMPEGQTSSATWKPAATYDADKLQAFADQAAGFTVQDLKRKSPASPDETTPADFLRAISQAGEQRLVFTDFKSQGEGAWRCPPDGTPHDPIALRKLIMPPMGKGVWFLVNPVDGNLRINKSGKQSRRSEENLTSFPFLLLESDIAPPGLWVAALASLTMPIVAIYESGGKSVHALVRIGATTADEWRQKVESIRVPLVTLGADEAAMTMVRLSRLPQCYRAETGKWQRLLYLNGAPDGTPIIEQPDRNDAAQTKQPTGENKQ